MKIEKSYVVYELNEVMASKKHLALEKVEFNGVVFNSFDSEADAIQALLDDKKTWRNYVILPQIFIRS